VTLKSRLRVTKGQCKPNHRIDHTRLSSIVELYVEYYRDLEMWVRGHSRSLKIVSFEEIESEGGREGERELY